MAERVRQTRTCGPWPPPSLLGWKPAWVMPLLYKGQGSEGPEDVSVRPWFSQVCHEAPPEFDLQPPAAPAVTEAASVHLARWAPHPSADTAPGTEPSPRMPALLTMPPRQKLVDEATSVKAVSPAADPSSLPVAEFVHKRPPAPWRQAWLTGRQCAAAPECWVKWGGAGETRPEIRGFSCGERATTWLALAATWTLAPG
jgi:hypothetical protein